MNASTTTVYTISTASGSFSGTLQHVCEWQAENQGAFASVSDGDIEVDVDEVDFDLEDMTSTVASVRALLDAV